jgi:hypothetical protein
MAASPHVFPRLQQFETVAGRIEHIHAVESIERLVGHRGKSSGGT